MAPLTVVEQLMLFWTLDAVRPGRGIPLVVPTTFTDHDVTLEITSEPLAQRDIFARKGDIVFATDRGTTDGATIQVSPLPGGATLPPPLMDKVVEGDHSATVFFQDRTVDAVDDGLTPAAVLSSIIKSETSLSGTDHSISAVTDVMRDKSSANGNHGDSTTTWRDSVVVTGAHSSDDQGTAESVRVEMTSINTTDSAQTDATFTKSSMEETDNVQTGMTGGLGDENTDVNVVNTDSLLLANSHGSDITSAESAPISGLTSELNAVTTQYVTSSNDDTEPRVTSQSVMSHPDSLTPSTTTPSPAFTPVWSGKDMVVGAMIAMLSLVTILALLVFVLWRRRSYHHNPQNILPLRDFKRFHRQCRRSSSQTPQHTQL